MTARTLPHVSVIAAMTSERVIGGNNQLLWHLPEDMAHFKRHTLGATVIMGRKTWESLPPRFRPLPGRRNVVISRDPSWTAPGAEAATSMEQALARFGPDDRVWVIGGAQIYQAALPYADRLVITELRLRVDGDAHFPPWPTGTFQEAARESHRAAPPNDFSFDFVTYERTAA